MCIRDRNLVGTSIGNPTSLKVLPNGNLVAGGRLTLNGSPSMSIVRWDGNSWQELDEGIGFSMSFENYVVSLAFSREGELFATGSFATMGPHHVQSAHVARAVSTCPADVAVFGAGCNGTAGPVTLAAQDLPWTGSTFHSRATGMAPSSLAVHALGSMPTVAPLPGGAPGCSLFQHPDVLELLVPNAGVVDATVQVPANPALVGITVRTQVVGIELGAGSALTLVTSSNALECTVGAL